MSTHAFVLYESCIIFNFVWKFKLYYFATLYFGHLYVVVPEKYDNPQIFQENVIKGSEMSLPNSEVASSAL